MIATSDERHRDEDAEASTVGAHSHPPAGRLLLAGYRFAPLSDEEYERRRLEVLDDS